MSEELKEQIAKIIKRSKKTSCLEKAEEVKNIALRVQGNFSIVALYTKNGIHIGVSKRNPKDESSQQIAYNIALSRAVKTPAISR